MKPGSITPPALAASCFSSGPIMRHRVASRHHPRPGAIAAQVALSLTVVLGVAAVALDGGLMLAERTHAQATADAAALAAAVDLIRAPRNSSTTATAEAAARQTGSNVGGVNYGYSDS